MPIFQDTAARQAAIIVGSWFSKPNTIDRARKGGTKDDNGIDGMKNQFQRCTLPMSDENTVSMYPMNQTTTLRYLVTETGIFYLQRIIGKVH